jgi:hypothetical protein
MPPKTIIKTMVTNNTPIRQPKTAKGNHKNIVIHHQLIEIIPRDFNTIKIPVNKRVII